MTEVQIFKWSLNPRNFTMGKFREVYNGVSKQFDDAMLLASNYGLREFTVTFENKDGQDKKEAMSYVLFVFLTQKAKTGWYFQTTHDCELIGKWITKFVIV